MDNDVKNKIMALLRKASDSAATPAEAEGAMGLAQKLMARHSLTQDEVMKAGEAAYVDRVIDPKRTRAGVDYIDPVTMYTARIVSEFCGVVCFTSGKQIKWSGLDSDVEMAMWMIEAFREQMEHDWTIFKRHELGTNRFVVITDARRSFVQGFTKAISARLSDWLYRTPPAGEKSSSALVVNKRELAMNRLRDQGISLSTKRHNATLGNHTGAAGAGMNAGNAASMGRAMGGGVKQIGVSA